MKLFLFTIFQFFIFLQASANHLMGADMEYRDLGNKKILVIAHIYRDCKGIPFSGPSFGVYAGAGGGNGCGNYSLSIPRTGIRDVTPVCPYSKTPCSPPNAGSVGDGLEEHTYMDTFDFSTTPLNNFVNKSSCCEVTFFIGQCCRSGTITTGPAGNDFWCTCSINICNIAKTASKSDNSPAWNTAATASTPCGKAFRYSFGVNDPDGDSVVYHLVPAINTLPLTSVSYSSPFTYSYPMTPYCVPSSTIKCTPNTKANPPQGFFFDTSNGDMVFTPSKCDEFGVITVEATSRRKVNGTWLVMSKIRRDISLVTNSPIGINDPPQIICANKVYVSDGDSVFFDVLITDSMASGQSGPDTPAISFSPMPGLLSLRSTTRTGINTVATFCLKPAGKITEYQKQQFSIFVNDQHCNKPMVASRAITVYLVPKDSAFLKYTPGACGNLIFTASAKTKFPVTKFSMILVDSATGDTAYSGNGATQETGPLAKRTYYVVLVSLNQINSIGAFRDTIHFSPQTIQLFLGNDTALCRNDGIVLFANTGSSSFPLRYMWVVNGTKLKDTTKEYTLTGIKQKSKVTTIVQNGSTCSYSDTIWIDTLATPYAFFKTNPDSIAPLTLSPAFISTNLSTISAPHKLKYKWYFGSSAADTSHSREPIITYPFAQGRYQCSLVVTAENGCQDIYTKTLYVQLITDGVRHFADRAVLLDNQMVCQCTGWQFLSLYIFDLSGKLVVRNEVNIPAFLNPGIYIYHLLLRVPGGEVIYLQGKKIIAE